MVRTFKNGGIRFFALGRLRASFCVAKPKPVIAETWQPAIYHPQPHPIPRDAYPVTLFAVGVLILFGLIGLGEAVGVVQAGEGVKEARFMACLEQFMDPQVLGVECRRAP